MKSTTFSPVEMALDRLGIRYRAFPLRNGFVYFCTAPNKLTFDLFLSEDGTVNLWRFVETAPLSQAGRRREYSKPEFPHAVLALEVTEEGDVSLSAQQQIDPDDPQREKRISKLVEGYVALIAHISVRNSAL